MTTERLRRWAARLRPRAALRPNLRDLLFFGGVIGLAAGLSLTFSVGWALIVVGAAFASLALWG